ncbi:hypothetical protein Btru_061483 [Bulinus truncatus]|nr:hypothetical protein Btru_061483 [Bulinus truncatus]
MVTPTEYSYKLLPTEYGYKVSPTEYGYKLSPTEYGYKVLPTEYSYKLLPTEYGYKVSPTEYSYKVSPTEYSTMVTPTEYGYMVTPTEYGYMVSPTEYSYKVSPTEYSTNRIWLHENHNTRYRDLPPRFKRQKSSTSPSPPVPVNSSDKILQDISSQISDNKPAPELIINSVDFKVSENSTCDNFSSSKTTSPSMTMNSVKWSAMPRKEIPVLSSVDNQFFNLTPAVHIPLGTQFGYSPPLSPWNMSIYSGPTGLGYKNDPWSQTPGESYGLLSPAKLNFQNENRIPLQNTIQQHSPVSSWPKPAFSPQLSSNVQNTSYAHQNTFSHLKDKLSPPTVITQQSSIDYSDPDIRTIEMLRELERVADEKQNDDFGVDRKSLVSHHLRMLMCAVDRYTEGIEDEMSRIDEVATIESTAHTPKLDSPSANSTSKDQMWIKNVSTISAERDTSHKILASKNWTRESKMESSLMRLADPCHSIDQKLGTKPVQTGTWDLWSSPSFDICDVLSHPLPCNVSESELPHFDLFGSCTRGDTFNIDEIRHRKPLYKR